MKNIMTWINIILLLVILGFGGVAVSGEDLPVPDGGDSSIPPASIEGEIDEVTSSELVIQEKGTGEIFKVDLTGETKYFTAFGGIVKIHELRPGQVVWVWCDGCGQEREGSLKAQAVKIFSLDPDDRPGIKH